MEDQLILVNEQDEETGTCGKLEAHEKGLLHRAFSIFIFRRVLIDNPDGTRSFSTQLLVQKRAEGKYHSGGLWANSCCSHPRAGETLKEAAARRLLEETGIMEQNQPDPQMSAVGTCTPLEEAGAFIYKAEFDNGLTEHELDHVFVGWLNEQAGGTDIKEKNAKTGEIDFAEGRREADWPGRNPEEASEMFFADVDMVIKDLRFETGKYAAWFAPALTYAITTQMQP